LYGCKTWSVTLREEQRLRVPEKNVSKRVFGPKREGVAEDWRKIHSEELHNLYASPNIIKVIKVRRMRCAGHVARMVDMRNAYKILLENLKGRDYAEDLGVDGKIKLERILGK
jgi:hypothetical protein